MAPPSETKHKKKNDSDDSWVTGVAEPQPTMGAVESFMTTSRLAMSCRKLAVATGVNDSVEVGRWWRSATLASHVVIQSVVASRRWY
eukprot:COSAG01_NODE_3438_length_6097_cov_4.738746_1_plen_87_part_00